MNAVSLLALFPLDVVLFPGAPLPLHIFEPRYKEMINECLEQKRSFGMVRANKNALAEIGCTAVILDVSKKYDDGRLDIMTEGKQRFEIVQLSQERSFLQGEVLFFEDEPGEVPATDLETVVQLHEQLLDLLGQNVKIDQKHPRISFHLAHELPVDLDFKQALLEMKSETERVETLIEYYRATIPKVEKALHAREKAIGNGHVH
ncbi:MAG TPA: LON peptidase substrate-binding domain-containing protein [Candidatus Angelobacter sp.]|jgi:Lon protease-like protein|nr:LON peptidase substrate-binding domain-containing protein [Candidatus Angelobacter sp.]